MIWLIECIYCNNFVYHLSDGRVKCSVCHKKTSKKRINKILNLIEIYVSNVSALEASKRVGISYVSVQKYYKDFRILSATICEREYEQLREKNCEYEEYMYQENSKKNKDDVIFDAHNFLTFDYDGHIYTILMPSLQRYKKQFLEDNLDKNYIKEFKKFQRDYKIIKVSKHLNNIVKFWDYFEKEILKYKGVNYNSFIYFLKEFEFKYNHKKDEAIDLIVKEYFKE